jgi:hypothetical protein
MKWFQKYRNKKCPPKMGYLSKNHGFQFLQINYLYRMTAEQIKDMRDRLLVLRRFL